MGVVAMLGLRVHVFTVRLQATRSLQMRVSIPGAEVEFLRRPNHGHYPHHLLLPFPYM